ncbi:MAG: S4 domain-containing protein [Arsenophonus sp.]|nr:MAG: S4 domain-containing protein [Arsenophonus sp.]
MTKYNSIKFITINQNNHEQRIDNFLFTQFKKVPKSRIYNLIRRGKIRINHKKVQPKNKINTNDIITLPSIQTSFKKKNL